MQSILVQLELINKERAGLKERLFEWVADLSQEEFDQLCNEIISLDHFFMKYDGVMVTDRIDLVRPFLAIIPKVEMVVDMSRRFYDKTSFYRWLENVHVSLLQNACWNLEDCCDQARELLDTYVVSGIFPTLAGSDACWKIDTADLTGNLSGVAGLISTWGTRIVHTTQVTAA
jgi:hypothetical protein